MSEQLLTILKLCLLALLYLFFLRVLHAVWKEINPPKEPEVGPLGAPVAAGAGSAVPRAVAAPPPARASGRRGRKEPRALVVMAPEHLRGTEHPIGDEMTLGRGGGCTVVLDDTFASQVHARVHRLEGRVILEDLGSTNGTLVNDQRVSVPTPLQRGDRLTIGSTVLEVA